MINLVAGNEQLLHQMVVGILGDSFSEWYLRNSQLADRSVAVVWPCMHEGY